MFSTFRDLQDLHTCATHSNFCTVPKSIELQRSKRKKGGKKMNFNAVPLAGGGPAATSFSQGTGGRPSNSAKTSRAVPASRAAARTSSATWAFFVFFRATCWKGNLKGPRLLRRRIHNQNALTACVPWCTSALPGNLVNYSVCVRMYRDTI